MRKLAFSILALTLLFCSSTEAQQFVVFKRHDPNKDPNLNPYINPRINPDSNSMISPTYNWNMNPVRNNEVNPNFNSLINPKRNLSLDPQNNELLNPVMMKSLLPAHPSWNGTYIFNNNNEIFGYISQAWNGYFVNGNDLMYNFFTIGGVLTGMFICYDNSYGFNLFDKNGKWTGMHIK